MSNIQLWFPTPIYYEDELLPKKELTELTERCYEIKKVTPSNTKVWHCDVYTTFNVHDITKDKTFECLVNEVTKHVNQFAVKFGSNHVYTCQLAWFNMYEGKHFQEYHYHEGCTFSAVYYLKAPEGSAGLFFNSPLSPDMMPVKSIKERTNLSYEYCEYGAIENRLIIFRSSLQHGVRQGTNKDDRISIAFNF
jgi:uncharacterized protein (TIGR02466 family)